MEENQNIGGNENIVATPTTPAAEETAPSQPVERTYNKAEIQNLMKRRVERSHNAFFKRYGVKDLKGLDELFENANSLKGMKDEYGAIQLKYSELARENAFLRNNINPAKYEDIITHFKGLGIDFSEEQLLEALKTHPEWLKQATTITRLGSESHAVNSTNEKESASKLLGVKL